MTLTQIEYFLKTAEKCNFTQAASELFITQQVLSRQIQALEKEIGFLLFQRNNRRHVELTPSGQLMYDTWKPFVEQTEIALAQAAILQKKTILRVGVPNIVQVLDKIIEIVQNYMDEHEEVEIELVVDSSNKLRWKFEQKELDVFVAFSVNTQELMEKHPCQQVEKMEFGVICSKRHPLAKKQVITATDLDKQSVCMFNDSYAKNIEKNLLDIYRNANIKPASVKRYDNWQNMALALELDKGINLGFKSFVEMKRGLVYIPLAEELMQDDIWLMTFAKDTRSMDLIETIKREFDK